MNARREPAENRIGHVLSGKYRLIRVLGEGGMGAVYEAEHTLIQRRVAVKVMHSLFASVPDSVERFLREARAAGSIGHPNIIEVQDIGEEEDGTVYIVMELLQGETLEDILNREGKVSPDETISIVIQVLSALHAAHKKGILHRDLKPDNIFLAEDSRRQVEVKLFDFGVAKFQDMADDSLGLTKTGTVLGTPYYLAPEQAKGGKNIDQGIDIWSVGVVMYEILTGQLPFEGDNYNEVLGKILLEEPEPIRDIAPEVPPGLADVAEKALIKDPAKRYRTVAEMIEILIPMHNRDETMFSTTVFSALKNSFLPPTSTRIAPEDLDPDDLVEISSDELVPSSDYLAQTIASQPPNPGKFRLSFLSLNKLIAGAGAIVVALVVVLLVLFSRANDETDAEEVRIPRTETVKSPVAAKLPVKKVIEKPTPEPKDILAPLPLLENSEISIELTGAPPNAQMSLDDKKTTFPLTLKPSNTPVILKITAAGYKPFIKALIPNRTQRIEIAMTKKTLPKTKSRKNEPPPFNKAKKAGKVWAQNPFGEK